MLERQERIFTIAVKIMSLMWKRREQTHHCGNTYLESTME